ncbi:hypothetical protein IFM46972_10109 [Aspergillus udagawae]|uniref:Uncharacterized protein n=1 Tax=Aspergillus udagawae TaxID=91492 RepID=A0A8H3SAW5_9EURO|nr:hypothetical protein IFM46972_10109 [Aspergillus udagawae]
MARAAWLFSAIKWDWLRPKFIGTLQANRDQRDTLFSKIPERLIPDCTCNISLHHESLPNDHNPLVPSQSTYPQDSLERKSKNIIVEAATAAADETNSLRAVDLVVLVSMLVEVHLHLTEEHSQDIHDGKEDDDLGGCMKEEDQAGVFGHRGLESD